MSETGKGLMKVIIWAVVITLALGIALIIGLFYK